MLNACFPSGIGERTNSLKKKKNKPWAPPLPHELSWLATLYRCCHNWGTQAHPVCLHLLEEARGKLVPGFPWTSPLVAFLRFCFVLFSL